MTTNKKSVIVILALATVIGITLFFRTQNNKPGLSGTPAVTQNSDVSSWETYTNKTYGYILKFPATYQVRVKTEKEKIQLGVDNNIVVEKKSDPSGNSVIVIDVFQNKENMSLDDYMNQNSKSLGVTGPLVKYIFNGYDSLFNKNQSGINVFAKQGQSIYHITASTASSDKEVADIVATFKFTQ